MGVGHIVGEIQEGLGEAAVGIDVKEGQQAFGDQPDVFADQQQSTKPISSTKKPFKTSRNATARSTSRWRRWGFIIFPFAGILTGRGLHAEYHARAFADTVRGLTDSVLLTDVTGGRFDGVSRSSSTNAGSQICGSDLSLSSSFAAPPVPGASRERVMLRHKPRHRPRVRHCWRCFSARRPARFSSICRQRRVNALDKSGALKSLEQYSLMATQMQTQGKNFETFETGSILVSTNDPKTGQKAEVTVENDALRGDEDDIEVSFQTYKDGQPQRTPFMPHITCGMKMESGTWKLNEISVTVHLPLGGSGFAEECERCHEARRLRRQESQSPAITMFPVDTVLAATTQR